MSQQPVASAQGPINGNENSSSPDFGFLELPASGSLTVQIDDNPNASSITFSLWYEKNNWPDSEVQSGLKNGATLQVSKVDVGDTYYIGNPSNAGNQSFVVTFVAG